MPANESLEIIIRLRDLATRGLRSLRRSLGGIDKAAIGIKDRIFSLKGALLGIGAGVVAHQFLRIATSFEQMELQLEQLTKGRGRQTLEEINEWAKTMPVNTEEAVRAFISMQSFGLDPTLEKMEILTDIATIMGQDAFPRVSRALGQMAALGKVSAEELNQLSEVGINARKILKDAFGQTVEEVQRSGRDINEVIDAIWAGLQGQFGGASAKALDTWGGIINVLKSYWIDFVKTVADNDVFLYLKEALKLLLETINELAQEGQLEDWAETTAKIMIAAFKRITQGAAIVADAFRIWRISLEGIKAAFALVAMFLNEGLANISTAIDWVVQRFADLIDTMATGFEKVAKIDPTGVFKNMATSFRAVADAVADMGDSEEFFEKNAGYWEDVVNKSAETITNLMGQESILSKTNKTWEKISANVEATKKRIEEAKKATEDQAAATTTTATTTPTASPATLAAAELKRIEADVQRALAQTQIMFENGQITAEQYYNVQVTGAKQAFLAEQALLAEQLKAEKKVDAQKKIQAEMYANEQEFQEQLLQLQQERIENEDAARQDAFAREKTARDLHLRELVALSGGFDMSTVFTQELLAMDAAHAEEIQKLTDQKAALAVIEDTYRVQQLEKDKLLAKQRIQLQDQILSATSQSIGELAGAFKDFYDNMDDENRQYFKIYKALSIAQALIDTYQSGVTAYLRGLEIPVVGTYLAPVFAATAVATGLMRVALIRSQNYATGGEIKGHSPHSRADNIPINATAGEFMHPVSAVKYYGKGVMEAIRTRSIPREMLAGFRMPNYRVGSGNFQQGGAVNPRSAAAQGPQDSGVTINNIVDPTMMDRHIQSTPGQKSVMNVLSENQYAVKQLVVSA